MRTVGLHEFQDHRFAAIIGEVVYLHFGVRQGETWRPAVGGVAAMSAMVQKSVVMMIRMCGSS